ncbi:hypothetical protein [Mesorhizobium silamurunense]|uniref:hypothetical protein n=1 Tax=Mesorhizobium silamurunense TaxID=499528 RepID=UPI0017808DE5|nr:hypothetical protein [Mesorhizobium silamurunense]
MTAPGEMQRREVRERLNAMPKEKRIAAVHSLDPSILDAVLSAPRVLVDIPSDVLDMAESEMVKKLYGDEQSVLADLDSARAGTARSLSPPSSPGFARPNCAACGGAMWI